MLFTISLLLLPNISFAIQFGCNGKIAVLLVMPGDDVAVKLTGSTLNPYVCNVTKQGKYTISPTACKMIYDTLLSAKLTGSTVNIYYDDPVLTCSTLPDWKPAYSAFTVGIN